ncbi:NADH:ubiquinone oxidoreductase [Peribacillus sp. NJ4]|uniref:NADH:ubiquinone oxidoreductase n=1 Tax=Peribacillus sp. NJ4 TaxID=3055862 RepID=UPI0025A25B2B|nr:NADH:ubiquinone oxidoreductase [Peribacillus sp. NJ4]MDM5214967.1 NADH:ubiquinone oxidoreductase [Peribacillus sp. NJ4]
MYRSFYNHPIGYSNIYQNPYNYPNGYPNVYQNPYHIPNRDPYPLYQNHSIQDFYIRVKFADIIGQYFTTTKPFTTRAGYTIPANTRVFIHNVVITSTGEELVTIVAPVVKDGTTVNESIKDILGNQL